MAQIRKGNVSYEGAFARDINQDCKYLQVLAKQICLIASWFADAFPSFFTMIPKRAVLSVQN